MSTSSYGDDNCHCNYDYNYNFNCSGIRTQTEGMGTNGSRAAQ